MPLQSRAWKDVGFIAQFFDNLIGNEDRHQGNVLVTRNFRGILIDHSRTFRVGKSFEQALRDALSGLLSETEIQAVVARRKILLLEVGKIVDRYGGRSVLY